VYSEAVFAFLVATHWPLKSESLLTPQVRPLVRTIQVSRVDRFYLCTLLPNGVRGHAAYQAASHFAAIAQMPEVNVRYRGKPGKDMLALSSSQFDRFGHQQT
jgi:hypothetical protein